jgi:large subunit ribosomal protein L15
VKSHDLRPAPGSRKPRTRVGRGIAAGKGKTAGRGTKGQRSRAGASIPSWFEGGQTPIHIRIPKLRGFKRYGRIEYQVVNVGRIGEYASAGRFGDADGREPITVNAEVLRAAGLVSSAAKPLKILGNGDLDVKLFVAAEAFTASARTKIEAAGGFAQSLAPEKASRDTAASDEPPAKAVARKAAAAAPTADDEPPTTVQDAEPTTAEEADPTTAEAVAADEPGAADEPASAAVAALEPAAEEPADVPTADEPADSDRATE